MKKIFNKIGQVLQLVLAAPVKLPGKVGNVLKYLALGLGILETVLDEAKSQPEVDDRKDQSGGKGDSREETDENPVSEMGKNKSPSEATTENNIDKNGAENGTERSAMDEIE